MEIPKKHKKYLPDSKEFPGFPAEPTNNYWRYPRVVNGWWHKLTGSEQKVLDYILRHTWGYDKDSDAISFTQFQNGIYSKKDHKQIDKGTGLGSQAITEATKRLEEKKFITIKKENGKTNIYRLRIRID